MTDNLNSIWTRPFASSEISIADDSVTFFKVDKDTTVMIDWENKTVSLSAHGSHWTLAR
jgi:hypothetical protein